MEEIIAQEQSTINKIACLTGVLGTLNVCKQSEEPVTEVIKKILELVKEL